MFTFLLACKKEETFHDVKVELRVYHNDRYEVPFNRIISFFEYENFNFGHDFDFEFRNDSLGTNEDFFFSSGGRLFKKVIDSTITFDTIIVNVDTTINRIVELFYRTDTAVIVRPQFNYRSNLERTYSVVQNVKYASYYIVVGFQMRNGTRYFSYKWTNVDSQREKIQMFFRCNDTTCCPRIRNAIDD